MQIVVHDNKMRKVALLNNRFSKMLSFHGDAWHRYLIQATSTFDFSIPKMYNGRLHEDLGFINDKAYFSFKFQGKHHLFYVANITEDDFNITLNCNNTNLELVNEQANPFTSNSAQTIEWYLQRMELLLFANLEIGVNEIADSKRTLTFESQESKLSRLQSLMSRFDAEFEFVTELNNNGTLKRIVLNIYREADSEHHGIGKVRNDVVLRYGKDVKGVQVTTDKTQLFNAGEFTGADGLTLKDVERSDKDAKGREEFYTRKGNAMVYAPISMESYPASMKSGDNWTRKDFQTEYTNVNDLAAYAFRTIKQYAYPIVTYTANVQSNFLNDYQDLVLGDTVKIYDKNFVGGLILQARVTEQVISFSNPNNNTLTFSNYVKLDSKISDTLRKRMAELIEERLPYTLKMSASAGTSFKNGTGESIVTPELYKGQKKITDATYRYYFGQEMTTGTTYKILASKITNTQVLTVAAYIDNNEVTRDELTFVNVNDGQNGVKGDKGERGEKGAIDEEKLKEIEQNINSKADSTLTQEQLNALNEKNSIMQAELEAKASLDTVNQWFKAYQDFVNSNAADKAKSEKDLIAATQRVAKIENNLGDMAQRWNFIDTYMQATNEGLSIGKKDGSSFVRMGDNRISFYSAGKEVAYFSGGALQVDNGVFTKTLQIGRFREEQYHLNPDMNVIRYVGGK
ncbi:phage tail protein [Streptococcus intermedius]